MGAMEVTHECVIGMLHDHDLHQSDIKERLDDEAYGWNKHANTMNYIKGNKDLKSDYKAADFIDNRKSGSVTKYNFCPYCGVKVDWLKVKELFKD